MLPPGQEKHMGAANAYKQAYRSAELETVSQRDLIVRLYQGAERFLIQAQVAINNRQIEMAHINCQKAKAIFSELLATLNVEAGGDVGIQLRDLYVFLITSIVEANLKKDGVLIGKLLPIIASLREAWQQIPDEYAQVTSTPSGHSLSFKT